MIDKFYDIPIEWQIAIFTTIAGIFLAAIYGTINLLLKRKMDKLSLKGKLEATGDIETLNTIGCAGLKLTVTCKGTRSAKIKGASLSFIAGHEFIDSFQKGFGVPLGDGSRDLPCSKCIVKLISLSKPTNNEGYILERDDVCNFFLPIQIPFLKKINELPSEDVSICIQYYNGDEEILLKGLHIQDSIRCLFELFSNVPMNLRKPLSISLSVSTTTPPDCSKILGKTNPRPIKF